MATAELSPSLSHIKDTLSITPDDYMKDRVVKKIEIYTQKSRRYEILYYVTSVIGIVSAATVPVLINLGVDPIAPTLLSLVVTILVSLEKLFHFREHWRNYDSISAYLRGEQLLFQTVSGHYAKKADKPEEAFALFVKNVEKYIEQERSDTIGMRTREEE